MTSLSSANSYSPFSSQAERMTQSQTPGLDTLAEGSQYALEQLQLAREADAADLPSDPGTLSPRRRPNIPNISSTVNKTVPIQA